MMEFHKREYWPKGVDLGGKEITDLIAQNADLVAALEAIQSIVKDSSHRTQRTLLQTCRFFDELILPTIDHALAQVGDDDYTEYCDELKAKYHRVEECNKLLVQQNAALVDMLRQAWVAVGTLDEDCLGYGTAAFGSKRWPLRNELLRDIEALIGE